MLLSCSLLFNYFMLVALEASGFLCGLVLLLLYPAIGFCGSDLEAMAMTAWKLLEAEAMRWVGDPRAQVVWTSAMLRVMMGASGMPLDLSML